MNLPFTTLAQNTFSRTQSYIHPEWNTPALIGVNEQPNVGLAYRQNINQTGTGLSSYEVGFSMPLNTNYAGISDNSGFMLSSSELNEKLNNSKASRRKHGIGINLRSLRFESFHRNEIQLNYAFHLPLSKQLNLSFGTNLTYGASNISADQLTVRYPENDELYQQILSENGAYINELLASAGMAIYAENFYFSATLQRIYLMQNGNLSNEDKPIDAYQPFFSLAYQWNVSQFISIIPNLSYHFQAPYDNSMAGNIRVSYNNFIYLGVGIQDKARFSGLFGARLTRDLLLNYSYDTYNTYGQKLSNGVHEVSLTYIINNKRATLPLLW